jgi:copper transport protein
MRHPVVVAVLAGLWLLATGGTANAHALLRDSDPASGASLDRAPQAVSITLSEPPDPRLSSIRVLDQSGRPAAAGTAGPVPGRPLQLRVALRGGLPDGVYGVVWRVLSRTDGHVTTGSFSFGVGVDPGAVPTAPSNAAASSPPPSPLSVAGRWLLYWGLALLVGAAATGLVVFGGRLPGRPLPLLLGALGLALAGLAAMGLAEWLTLDASLGSLARSSVGQGLVRQTAALAVAGLALAAFAARPRARWSLAVVGLAGAGAMLAHVSTGHAVAESSLRWLNLLTQWVHVVAVGIWVGGLVWLLIGIRAGAPPIAGGAPTANPPLADEQPDGSEGGAVATGLLQEAAQPRQVGAVKRFSVMAGWTVLVIVVTGTLRALDEVGGWGRLLDTSFGQVLDVKVLLFLALLATAALNRQRIVPALAAGLGRLGVLRRNVRAELGLAALVLLATGLLTELAPGGTGPGQVRPAAPAQVEATGNDYATTVRVKLVATPGTPGPNSFRATVTDYDSGEPFPARRVQLSFSLPSKPDLGESTIDLSRGDDGAWSGRGGALVAPGRWDVTALVQRAGGGAVTVPLELETRTPPQKVEVSKAPGQPTVYTISLAAGGTLQAYADPGKAGPNQLHFTFFGTDGNEHPVGKAEATARPPSGAEVRLRLLRLGPGHFAANTDLTAGRWAFAIDAQLHGETGASARFEQVIGD